MSGDRRDDGVGSRTVVSGIDSPVVTATVRLVTPFVLTFGLFTAFHGTSSVGGGFQGGVIVAASVVLVLFTFGLDRTLRWLDTTAITGLVVGGVVVFAGVAVAAIVFGGPYLDLPAYPVPKAVVYGVELIELGIGTTVATAIVAMVVEVGRRGRR